MFPHIIVLSFLICFFSRRVKAIRVLRYCLKTLSNILRQRDESKKPKKITTLHKKYKTKEKKTKTKTKKTKQKTTTMQIK